MSIIRESIPHLKSFYKFVFLTLQNHKTETKHQILSETVRKHLKDTKEFRKESPFPPRSKVKSNLPANFSFYVSICALVTRK